MDQALVVQTSLSELLKYELPAMLEQAFDEITPDGETLRIDALQLDLGIIPLQQAAHLFKEQLLHEIKKAVIAKKEKADKESGITVLRRQQSQREALFYFLEHGTKPWYNTINTTAAWEDAMLQQFTTSDWQKILQWLQRNINLQPVILERLAAQFSNTFLIKLLNEIVPLAQDDWGNIYHDLLALFECFSLKKERVLRSEIWRDCIVLGLNKKSDEEVLYTIVKKYLNQNAIDLKNNIGQIKDLIQTAAVRVSVQEVIKEMNSSATINKDETEIDNYEERTNSDNIDSATNKHKQNTQKREQDNASIINEAPYVNNCGVVLLHPFLEAYFEELQLLHKQQFIDADACKRAVLLLHYLATGETAVAEFNVLLQKVLCNLSLEETLPESIELTDMEKEESRKLLQSVINYWTPLKNTSVEGLQSTFLQREGKLEIKENGWRLTVEQKTVDILLDKLPWGFLTIHLPWMNNILSVDWC